MDSVLNLIHDFDCEVFNALGGLWPNVHKFSINTLYKLKIPKNNGIFFMVHPQFPKIRHHEKQTNFIYKFKFLMTSVLIRINMHLNRKIQFCRIFNFIINFVFCTFDSYFNLDFSRFTNQLCSRWSRVPFTWLPQCKIPNSTKSNIPISSISETFKANNYEKYRKFQDTFHHGSLNFLCKFWKNFSLMKIFLLKCKWKSFYLIFFPGFFIFEEEKKCINAMT